MVAPMLLGLGVEAFAAYSQKNRLYYVTYRDACWRLVLCPFRLTVVRYLSTQEHFRKLSEKEIWMRGNTRRACVFIYTLLVYFLLIFPIKRIFNNAIFDMVWAFSPRYLIFSC